jgi:hypothetical protein
LSKVQRHHDRHAVVRRAGLEAIAHGELRIADGDERRVARGIALVADHEVRARPLDRVLRLLRQAAVPRIERLRVVHVRRQAIEVPLRLPLFVDHQAGAALLGFFFLRLRQRGEVAREEGAARVDLAGEQRIAHEDLACLLGKQCAVMDRPLGREHQAEQRDLFAAHHAPLRACPARIVLAAREQVRQGLDRPVRFDRRIGHRPHALGVEQVRGQHPRRRLLRQRRTGEQLELAAARTVVQPAIGAIADLRRQARQQCAMQFRVRRLRVVLLPTEFIAQQLQLAMQLAPFAQAQEAEEVLLRPLAQLGLREVFVRRAVGIPQLEDADELRFRIGELARARYRRRRAGRRGVRADPGCRGRRRSPASRAGNRDRARPPACARASRPPAGAPSCGRSP